MRNHAVAFAALALTYAMHGIAAAEDLRPVPASKGGTTFTPLDERRKAFFAHVDEFGTDAGFIDQKVRNPFLGANGLPIAPLPKRRP